MSSDRGALIHQQFSELVQVHPGLALSEDWPGRWVVRGDLSFHITYESTTIEDTFSILIELPQYYPESLPTVQETGGRIPRDVDYHVMPRIGHLCLGAPLAVRLRFEESPCLRHFVNALVVPFLFSFSYRERYGDMPYGELSHGYQGIFEYYHELFGTEGQEAVLGLLKILAEDSYRGHLPCPCGSEKCLRNCHGEILQKIKPLQSQDRFLCDYLQYLDCLQVSERDLDNSVLPSKKTMARLEKLSR